MGVNSVVQIQNSALIKLGAEQITVDTENNTRARLVRERFPVVRDRLLRSHPWNFAIDFISLAAISPTPSNIFSYSYVYQLPSDCLRVLETSLGYDEEWEEISGKQIACNSDTLKIKYLKKITDVSKYDDNFAEVLAWDLAHDICYALTQSKDLKAEVKKSLDAELRAARSFDAQVGSVRRVVSDDWFDARR
jgi:hypothetical protein